MYLTCHTYKSLWMPFIKLKKKYISNIKMYLCTDLIKENDLNDLNDLNDINDINILNFNEKSNFSIKGNYFDRYLYYLNNIDTEYILYFLDDMYPLNIIDITILTRLIDIMNKNDNIKLIKLSLDSYPFNNGNKVIYDNIHFIKANNNLDEYILNLQPFIIKKNFFIDLVNYCKKNNTFTHQNGGLEVFGTNFFKNTNYIALRVINEVVKIPYSGGIVTSGIISDPIKKMLKEKEDIDIKTYDNNLIYELTNVELNNLGDRLKEHYNDLNIKCIDS